MGVLPEGLFNFPIFRLGKISPKLYELPRYEITLTHEDGNHFLFANFFGICVALEIENTGASNLEFSIDSRSARKIELAPQARRSYDNTTIDSIHIETSGAQFVIRAQLVGFEEIARSMQKGVW